MGIESLFGKKKAKEAFEKGRVIDPTTGAFIHEAPSIEEAKKKLREHFENEREAA